MLVRFGHEEYSIGFYRIFSPQITRLFADIYAESFEKWSPSVAIDQDGKPIIKYRDLFGGKDIEASRALPKIRPSFSKALKDYAILFSMAGLSNPLDHKLDFAKRAQISLVQNSGPPDNAGAIAQMVFRDPNTGIGYRAQRYDNMDFSLGFELLKDAQLFVANGSMPNEPTWPIGIGRNLHWTRRKQNLPSLCWHTVNFSRR